MGMDQEKGKTAKDDESSRRQVTLSICRTGEDFKTNENLYLSVCLSVFPTIETLTPFLTTTVSYYIFLERFGIYFWMSFRLFSEDT